jgi:hypothetical protein
MARQRVLHPNFFVDEKVVQVSAFARLMFQGMWCLADREGRLERKPLRLKMQLFPADAVDGEALICELEAVDLVRRYDIDGAAYVWIPGFKKHQHVHPKEVTSKLPAPPEPRPVDHDPGSPAMHQPKARAFPQPTRVEPGKEAHETGGSRAGSSGTAGPSGPSGTSVVRTPPVFVVEAPTSPPDTWLADDYWRWAQSKRQQAGFVAEKHPGPDLAGWYSQTLASLNGDVERLKEAFLNFGDSPFWQKPKEPPALPFRGFMSQVDRFIPRSRHAS